MPSSLLYHIFRQGRWRVLAMLFTGATVLQATSCQTTANEMAAELSVTIVNTYISNAVNEWFGLNTGLSQLGRLGL